MFWKKTYCFSFKGDTRKKKEVLIFGKLFYIIHCVNEFNFSCKYLFAFLAKTANTISDNFFMTELVFNSSDIVFKYYYDR